MPTYCEFREVLRKAGFQLVRSHKHELWRRVEPDGTKRNVLVKHQHGRDIPKGLFHEMLWQA